MAKGGKVARQPDGRIRRSQLITTYGPGAMVDLVDDAVLVWGLDSWRPKGKLEPIEEQRLRDRLAPRLEQEHGIRLAQTGYFRSPPGGDDRDPTWARGIRATVFPRWFVCENPECRRLLRVDMLQRRRERYVHDCTNRRPVCVPVRFVAACPDGHLEDFPWRYFVHSGPEGQRGAGSDCRSPVLKLHEGTSGDFSGVKVTCACGAWRRLADAKTQQELNPTCLGRRPWLGRLGNEPDCPHRVQLMVRTASNSYFSVTESALSIPEEGSKLFDVVNDHWDVLQAASAQTLSSFRTIPDVGDAIGNYSDAEVLHAVSQIKAGQKPRRDEIRRAEYKRLVGAELLKPADLPPPAGDDFFAKRLPASELTADLPAGVAGVTLAYKLREVRVQLGFTRFSPAVRNRQGETGGDEAESKMAKLGLDADWLPAVEIRGEGIFIELDEAAVRAWERRPEVREWEEELERGFLASQVGGQFPGARFFLLHSLAHLLITQLSLECGYSASAIRERIYCETAGDTPMAGILLKTGTPGSEGTLGGLVEQGHRIGHHLRRATELGQLCSNDPICAHHSPAGDLGERHFDGAACYACLFIAESSCEWFNRNLDRSVVVPVVGQPRERAFFSPEVFEGLTETPRRSAPPASDSEPAAPVAAPEPPEPAAPDEPDGWSEVLENCMLENTDDLVAALRRAGAPVPSAGEELAGGVPVELAWGDRSIAVVASEVDSTGLKSAGWTVFSEPVEPDDLVAAVRGES
ncbi:MAG: DrmB family protein [Myxococcota bacterium]